jgi:DNA invertase Pin-like site-specific DNA recombinase
MLKDATRGRFDVVMVWALDRLGRSLVGLLDTVRELESASVDLYVHQQVIDTTSAAGRLFFHIAGAFAEYEREMIRDRVTAALARLKAKGVKLGRPKVKPAVRRAVEVALGQGLSIRAAARAAGVSEGSAAKIRRALASEVTASEVTAPDPAASESIAPD